MQIGIGLAMTSLFALATVPGLIQGFDLRSGLPAAATFSRASSATVEDGGIMSVVASGVPRISNTFGLMIEGARTNSLANGNAAGATPGVLGSGGALPSNGWFVGPTSGLSTEIIGSLQVNGFWVLRLRVFGTASGTQYVISPSAANAVAAADTQVWTSSAYVAMVAGSLNGITAVRNRVVERDAASAVVATASTVYPVVDGNLRRASSTRTMTASAAFVSAGTELVITNGAAVDITIDVGCYQMEQAAFESSYIPTSGTAASRAGETCSMPLPEADTIRTIYAEFTRTTGIDSAANQGQRAMQVDGGNSNNRHFIGVSQTNGSIVGQTVTGNVTVSAPTVATSSITTYRTAYRCDTDNFRHCTNGVLSALDSSGALPTGMNTLRFGGSHGAGGEMYGWVKRIGLYNIAHLDAKLLEMAPA